MGPLAATGEAPQTIFINDAVAGVNYALDTRERVAHKMPPMRFEFKMRSSGDGKGEGIGSGSGVAVGTGAGVGIGSSTQVTAAPQVFERMTPPPGAGVRVMGPAGSEGMGPGMVFERATPAPGSADSGGMVFQWQRGRNENLKTESLGKQSIEGVEAEGTRNTLEIPAGEVGNERPIEIVFERWYSPELQMVVMTRHADPRFGETTYRLTNINRSEPAHELFEVPADYTLQEPPTMPAGPVKGIFGGVMNGKAITLPLPEYPASARQAKISGSVTVEVSIDETGNVVSARGVSGHPLLQAAAVTAARQAKFSPTKLSGQATKVNGVLVYTFAAQ
jgi:TonB family protein